MIKQVKIIDVKVFLYPLIILLSFIEYKTVPYSIALIIFVWLFVEKPKPVHIKKLTPILLYLISLLISFLLSEDKVLAITTVERFASLLILPVIIFNTKFKSRHLVLFKMSFIYSTLFLAVFSIIVLFVFALNNSDFVKSMDSSYLQWKLPNLISVHPTYFGYSLTTSLFLALEVVKANQKNKRLFTGLAFFITIYTIYLSSRVAVFSQLVLWLYYLVITLKSKRLFNPLTSLLFLIVVLFIITKSNYFVYKTSRVFNDERFHSWKFAFNKVGANELIFGQGVGKSKDILKMNWTKEKRLPENYLSWDFHNQYIKTYFDQGILGLFALNFLIIIYPLSKRNHLLIIFSLLISGSMLTESIFGRVSGVVFFSVLYGFFCIEKEN